MLANRAENILVGEDEPEVRAYFQMALTSLGYSVELAQDGEEVLASLRSSRGGIGAVLLDIVMPNRDGLDTLREIRALNPDLPVIMVSGVASSMNIVAAMKAGATDFLCKPVGHGDLRKAIGRALERNADPFTPAAPGSGIFLLRGLNRARAGRKPRAADEDPSDSGHSEVHPLES